MYDWAGEQSAWAWCGQQPARTQHCPGPHLPLSGDHCTQWFFSLSYSWRCIQGDHYQFEVISSSSCSSKSKNSMSFINVRPPHFYSSWFVSRYDFPILSHKIQGKNWRLQLEITWLQPAHVMTEKKLSSCPAHGCNTHLVSSRTACGQACLNNIRSQSKSLITCVCLQFSDFRLEDWHRRSKQ